MVSKITVSILALIGWDLLEWTGDEGKLLKLGELWAIKRSVLRRPLPLMREKKRCELSVVVSLGGERGQCVLSVAMMGWEMSERPPLASLWSKWSQNDLRWLRYDQSEPRKSPTRSGSDTFASKSTLSGWSLLVDSLCMTLSNLSSESLPIGKDCLSFGEIGSAFSFSISLFIVMSRTNGVPRCGCVRFDSLDWAGPAVAMIGCGRRKKSQHFANSLGEIQSFILIKASFSVIIHEGSLRT